MRNMLVVVALLAVPMLYLKRLASTDPRIVYLRGSVHVMKSGSIEVKGGAIRLIHGNKETEIQADTIVVKRDGTAAVYDGGTIQQRTVESFAQLIARLLRL
jgi:hypothetical protein